tara:strand:- start:3098 stop:3502 length:405 start_codon:yes stop_codon:yes gene_type:complete
MGIELKGVFQMLKCLLLLGVLVSCSSIKNKDNAKVEKKSISKIEKEKLKKLKSEIKFARSLSDLVGCSKLGELNLNKFDRNKLEYFVYLETSKLGGDTLSEVSEHKRRERPEGETVFSQGKIKHFFKSDVYRCK